MAGAWAFSVHMPGRLISHNFLILGSSQVQQMLLLPPLLNKVGREERNLSIVYFRWNQNKHCVCGISSNRKACAKSSFRVTQKQIRICPCIFNIMQMTFSSFYWGCLTVIAIQTCWFGFRIFLVLANLLILNSASSGSTFILSHTQNT